MRTPWLLLLSLSCSGGTGDGETPHLTATIVSPEAGEVFSPGEEIELDVALRVGSTAAEPGKVTWTIGDWTGSGERTSTTDIPLGDWTVLVAATVGEESAKDTVRITVEGDADGDTDADADADGDPNLPYGGPFDANIEYDIAGFEGGGPCPGTVTLTVGTLGFDGTGACSAEGTDFLFTIEGKISGTAISGDLIADADGTEYRTPFTGTGSYGESLSAQYDKTFTEGGDSLRIFGTFGADPL
jgi:hypothetical protein